MFHSSSNILVYLATGKTDMRKSINGLSILVEGYLEHDPFSGHLFVFCNSRRNIIKILYWERNGFCLWQKRLEKHIFKWPESVLEVVEIDQRQLSWLLAGNVHSLKEIILSLQEIHQEHKNHIELLQEQIRLLKAKLFGRKSEKLTEDDRRQLQLFDEAEDTLETSTPVENEGAVPEHTRKKPGRRPLPEGLPRVAVVHDLSDEERLLRCSAGLHS